MYTAYCIWNIISFSNLNRCSCSLHIFCKRGVYSVEKRPWDLDWILRFEDIPNTTVCTYITYIHVYEFIYIYDNIFTWAANSLPPTYHKWCNNTHITYLNRYLYRYIDMSTWAADKQPPKNIINNILTQIQQTWIDMYVDIMTSLPE